MGKKDKKHKGPVTKVKHLSDRKRLTISEFKEKIYMHFADQYSRKTFTLNYDEVKKLHRMLPKLIGIMKHMPKETNKTNVGKKEVSDISDCESMSGGSSYSDSD